MTHRPVEVDQRKRAANSRRRRCALLCSRLCVYVFDADLARPPTPRVPEITLSFCPLFFVVDVHALLNLLDPSLGSDAALGASRQGLSAYTRWAGRLRQHASNPAGARTPSVGQFFLSPRCARWNEQMAGFPLANVLHSKRSKDGWVPSE